MVYDIRETERGLMVAGAGPEMLRELLREYARLLQKLHPTSWSAARPGLPPETIHRRLGEVALEAPEELVVLWSWCDGIDPEYRFSLPFDPVPLDQSLAHRARTSVGAGIGQWPTDWIWALGPHVTPVGVRCNPSEVRPVVRRLDVWVYGLQDDGIPEHQSVSLCTPLACFLETYHQGLSGVDEHGQWIYDRDILPLSWRFASV